MDCDFSSSSAKVTDKDSDAKSSDSKSTDSAEVTDDSSDSKDNPSSAGTSTKSSNSNTSGNDAKSSSSAGKVNGLATPCKTETEDNCEYGELVDERDGQTYKTVKIGDQWWMAENLNYEYKVNDSTYGNYCYKDSTQYCAKYGRLYTWAAAMDSATTYCGFGKSCTATHPVQGICPSGWHLPDTTDWHDLIVAAGGKYSAGAKLKSTSGWENDGWGNDGNGTDAFGFSALPSGYRSRGGDYYTAGGYA
ncbi:MAG: fibrobacter succinogenes major paralogous domain-containing protein, partial [Fibrobacter sp.]|nr:fibrobacter succinogenes major paralogous domain-containing protein [Fibrobacter sp.]